MRNTFILFGTIVSFFFNQLPVFSQSNFYPGYIIKSNGDTADGFVKLNRQTKNPASISFRTTETSPETEYMPTGILGFFDGESHYVAAHVTIEKPSEGTSLEERPDFELYSDRVFLKYLVKGEKSLLYLRHNDDRDHFYIPKNDTFELLLYKEFLRTDDQSRTAKLSVKKYVSQLMDYFGDDNATKEAVARTEFKYNKLVRLFNDYYKSSKSNAPVLGVQKKFRVDLSALAGVSRTSASFGGSSYMKMGHSTSTDFTGGVSADLILAGRASRFSLANDFLYSSYDVTVTEKSNNTGYYLKRTSRIEASYIKLHTMVRYRVPLHKAYLFFNAGMSAGYALNIKDGYVEERISNGATLSSKEGRAVASLRKIELGYVAGAGVGVNRLQMQLRYERGNGVSAFRAFSTNATRYSLIAGYRLSR